MNLVVFEIDIGSPTARIDWMTLKDARDVSETRASKVFDMMKGMLFNPPLTNQLAKPFGRASVQLETDGSTVDVSFDEASIKGMQVMFSFELISWQIGMMPKLATGANEQFPEGQI